MSSSNERDSVMQIDSDHCVPHEYAELEEFERAVSAAGLAIFIELAKYDSGANFCEFTFRIPLAESSDEAKAIFDIAMRTISQFQWFGINYLGRGLEDE